ncbi:MAG TPA: hypothetical protein VIL35_08430 [Vicinamibacterales bacterium]
MISRLLLIAYLVEAGLLLTIGPWSALWDRNWFIQSAGEWGAALVRSGFVRGAVSGVGVLCVGAGIAELVTLLGRRAARPARGEAS